MNLIRKILFVKEKQPPIPVTDTELDQLDKEARKQELLARIEKAKALQAKAKGSGSSVFKTIQKVIGKSDYNPFDVSSPRRKRDNTWSF